MIPLPLYDPCTGCGRCCETIGMPPFEAANPLLGVRGPYQKALDRDLFYAMPTELLRSHALMIRELSSDPTGKPCPWLDLETKRCKHYEWRPSVCVTFPVDSDPCKAACSGPKVIVQWRGEDKQTPDDWRNPRRLVIKRLSRRTRKKPKPITNKGAIMDDNTLKLYGWLIIAGVIIGISFVIGMVQIVWHLLPPKR